MLYVCCAILRYIHITLYVVFIDGWDIVWGFCFSEISMLKVHVLVQKVA